MEFMPLFARGVMMWIVTSDAGHRRRSLIALTLVKLREMAHKSNGRSVANAGVVVHFDGRVVIAWAEIPILFPRHTDGGLSLAVTLTAQRFGLQSRQLVGMNDRVFQRPDVVAGDPLVNRLEMLDMLLAWSVAPLASDCQLVDLKDIGVFAEA